MRPKDFCGQALRSNPHLFEVIVSPHCSSGDRKRENGLSRGRPCCLCQRDLVHCCICSCPIRVGCLHDCRDGPVFAALLNAEPATGRATFKVRPNTLSNFFAGTIMVSCDRYRRSSPRTPCCCAARPALCVYSCSLLTVFRCLLFSPLLSCHASTGS